MKITVRFAHLAEKTPLKMGQTVNHGDIIGTMGNTGQSSGAHLHLDGAVGEQTGDYNLAMMDNGLVKAAPPRQLLYFIDDGLFGVKPAITTEYADVEYFKKLDKVHLGFDVVPFNRHATEANYGIHWNRSMPGRVCKIGYQEKGLGHYVGIVFEV